MENNVREILARNVLRLVAHRERLPPFAPDARPMALVRRWAKITNGDAQRLLDRKNLTIELVDRMARSFGLRAYQLLAPDINPENPPQFPHSEAERTIANAISRALRGFNEGPPEDVSEHQQEPVVAQRAGVDSGAHRRVSDERKDTRRSRKSRTSNR